MHDDKLATREMKIGLGILAILSVALCYVIAKRVFRNDETPPTEITRPFGEHIPTNQEDEEPTVLPPNNRYREPEEFAKPLPIEPFEPSKPVEPHEETEGKSFMPFPAPPTPSEEASRTTLLVPIEDEADNNIAPIKAELLHEAPPEAQLQEPEHKLEALPKQIFASRPEILPVGYASLRPGEKYRAKSEDTLEEIASRELGDASRWPEIYYLNRDQLPSIAHPITDGQIIILPNKGTTKK